MLRAAQSSIRMVLFNEGEGPHASACAVAADASAGRYCQQTALVLAAGPGRSLRLRIGAEDDAWPRVGARAAR